VIATSASWRNCVQLLLLAIETSGSEVSFALGNEGGILRETTHGSSGDLSRYVITWIDELFAACRRRPQELTAIGVSIGPGSWTGLRIGVATAKSLAYGLGIPLIGVSTFEALAHAIADESEGGYVVPLACARRDEVFAQIFRVVGGTALTEEEPHAYPLRLLGERLRELGAPVTLCGEGFRRHREALLSALPHLSDSSPRICRAAMIIHRLQSRLDRELPLSPLEVKPLYVVPSQAECQRGIIVTQ